MGAWHIQALKTAGLCAIFGLFGMGLLVQAQQAPKPPVSAEAPKATSPVKPKPNTEELERWRRTIVHTQPPEKACFVAEYPATAWTKVTCGKSPGRPYRPVKRPSSRLGADAGDDTALVPRHISWAEGSFDAVIGVHSACSAACPHRVCPTTYTCTSGNLPNEYGLQLNTSVFPTKACGSIPNCLGWQQFVFSNRGCAWADALADILISHHPACAFIQYQLIGFGKPCPSRAWTYDSPTNTCWINSQNAVVFKPFNVDDLGFMKLRGAIAGVKGQSDSVIFTYAGTAYAALGDNRLPELDQMWTLAEFNVFGDPTGSEVVLNPGSTLVVRIEMDNGAVGSGTLGAPQCENTSLTSETNNLWPIGLQVIPTNAPNTGPAQTYGGPVQSIPFSPGHRSTQQTDVNGGPWSKGPGPALVFAETNDPNLLSASVCQDVVKIPGTN